jgi:hypothetical protein
MGRRLPLILRLIERRVSVWLAPSGAGPTRRWVVERSLAWASRFRRLAKDFERQPETVAGPHVVTFACLIVPHRSIQIGTFAS